MPRLGEYKYVENSVLLRRRRISLSTDILLNAENLDFHNTILRLFFLSGQSSELKLNSSPFFILFQTMLEQLESQIRIYPLDKL